MNEAVKKDKFIKVKSFINDTLSSPIKTILYTVLGLAAILTVYFLVIYIFRDNFYNNWSDDILQYYPIMCDFVNDIKAGDMSFFNFKNYLGASIFSDAYYVPLDGFTLLIFLLSFVINTEVAMSIVEFVKILSGVAALMVYLHFKKVKPKYLFLIGILYFSSSGITCFSAFPSFTSLAFYLPASLIVAELFFRGKWYYTPIYAFTVTLYNFYLAYTVFAFMSFSILFMAILRKEKFFSVIWKTIKYVFLILLGLGMGMLTFLPAFTYILESTSREVMETSSLAQMLELVKNYIECFIELILSFFRLIKLLFTSRGGLFKNSTIVSDAFLNFNYLVEKLSTYRYVDGNKFLPAFFDIEELYRVFNNTFSPSEATSFYGYQSSYFIEHFSLYITTFGLLVSTYVWFLKDYRSKVYRFILLFIFFMMSLPLFSYILSANLSVLYTRWFSIISIPLLVIVGHVLTEKEQITNLKPSKLIFSSIILSYLALVSATHHNIKYNYYGEKNEFSETLLSLQNDVFYIALILIALVIASIIVFYFIETKWKKNEKRIKTIVCSVVGIVVVIFGIKLFISYSSIDTSIFNTSLKGELFDLSLLEIQQYLTLLSIVFMGIYIFSFALKKRDIYIFLICIEALTSGIYTLVTNVVMNGVVTTFNKGHDLGEFLNENIEDKDIYRIYIDPSLSGMSSHNVSRFMPVSTNEDIFHSFVYDGTDEFVDIVYGIKDEGQANKEALNKYSYYLNIMLGYKYIVASNNSTFKNYNEEFFSLVTETDEYILLKFKEYEPFLSYSNYCFTSEYDLIKSSLKPTTRLRFMTNRAIISQSDEELINRYIESSSGTNDFTDHSSSISYYQRKNLDGEMVEVTNDLGETKEYFRYEFSDDHGITTRSSAINVFGFESNKDSLVSNHHIFIEYDREYEGEKYQYLNESHIKSMNDSTFHIPLYSMKPKYLYICNETNRTIVPTLKYAIEAISATDYDKIEEYENGSNDLSISAYLKYYIGGEYEGELINVQFTSSRLSLSSMVIEYVDHTFTVSPSEMVPEKDILNIYIQKDSDPEIYNENIPPSIQIVEDIISPHTDNLINKDVITKGSTITLKYDNTNINNEYSIIYLPVPYSDEWEIVSGNVLEMFYVNGGFIGLIVPNNISSNEIMIKFNPKGFNLGLMISLMSVVLFGYLILDYIYSKKIKEIRLCKR